jgi:hypothetical protein
MAGAPTSGANIPLGANFAKVLADLERVIFKAAEARGALAGLPPPGGRGATSPRLPAMPGARVGGGKAEELRSNIAFKPSAEATHAAGLGGKSAISNGAAQSAIQAAAQRAATGPTRPRTLKHAGAVDAAADLAESKVTGRIARKLTEFQIQRGGVDLGPLQLNAQGIGLGATFSKLLGPVAGATLAAVGAVKAASALWDFESGIVAEAAKAGRDPRAVMFEKVGQGVSGLVKKAQGLGLAGADIGIGADLEILRILSGNSNVVPSSVGWVVNKITSALGYAWDESKAQQTAAGAHEIVSNAIARLKGEPTSQQRRQSAWDQNTRALDAALETAQSTLEEHARKVSEQLHGLGFPGTRDEFKKMVIEELKPEFDRAATEGHVRRVNGVQDAGE